MGEDHVAVGDDGAGRYVVGADDDDRVDAVSGQGAGDRS
jgi:hypothetical protein